MQIVVATAIDVDLGELSVPGAASGPG